MPLHGQSHCVHHEIELVPGDHGSWRIVLPKVEFCNPVWLTSSYDSHVGALCGKLAGGWHRGHVLGFSISDKDSSN